MILTSSGKVLVVANKHLANEAEIKSQDKRKSDNFSKDFQLKFQSTSYGSLFLLAYPLSLRSYTHKAAIEPKMNQNKTQRRPTTTKYQPISCSTRHASTPSQMVPRDHIYWHQRAIAREKKQEDHFMRKQAAFPRLPTKPPFSYM